jgi:hypothetical protein
MLLFDNRSYFYICAFISVSTLMLIQTSRCFTVVQTFTLFENVHVKGEESHADLG